jgi:hypothetical protein
MTFAKLTDTLAAKLRNALGPIPDTDRQLAHAVVDGRGIREIADFLGVSEKEAVKRVAAVIPGLALIAFPHRVEVAPHIIGGLIAVSPDLERALFQVLHDNLAHERQDGSATFAVMFHNGGTVGLFYGDRPPGDWISVETTAATS